MIHSSCCLWYSENKSTQLQNFSQTVSNVGVSGYTSSLHSNFLAKFFETKSQLQPTSRLMANAKQIQNPNRASRKHLKQLSLFFFIRRRLQRHHLLQISPSANAALGAHVRRSSASTFSHSVAHTVAINQI